MENSKPEHLDLSDDTINFENIKIFEYNSTLLGSNTVPFSFNKTETNKTRFNFNNLPENFITFDKINSKLSINTIYDNVWICLEDVSTKIKLFSNMKLRIGNILEGPEINIIIENDKIYFYSKSLANKLLDVKDQMDNDNNTLLFESNGTKIEIGRGNLNTLDGYEKCKLIIPELISKTISRCHAIIVYENNNWYLKQHPANPELDNFRERSTWLLLQQNINYLIGIGKKKDNHVALLIDDIPILVGYGYEPITTVFNEVKITNEYYLSIVKKRQISIDELNLDMLDVKIIISNPISGNLICEFNAKINCSINYIKNQIELIKKILPCQQKIIYGTTELFSDYKLNDHIPDFDNELNLSLVINQNPNYIHHYNLLEKNFDYIKKIPQQYLQDRNFIGLIVNLDGHALAYSSDLHKNDKYLVLSAIKKTPSSIIHASIDLLNDLDLWKEVFKLDKTCIVYAPRKIQCEIKKIRFY